MNKEITIYELLRLVKDDMIPRKIIYNNIVWEYYIPHKDYRSTHNNEFLLDDCFNNKWILEHLNSTIEIIDEENCEFEDIEELKIGTDDGIHFYIANEHGTKKCDLTKHSQMIADKVNQLIRNQNKIIERLKNGKYE